MYLFLRRPLGSLHREESHRLGVPLVSNHRRPGSSSDALSFDDLAWDRPQIEAKIL